MGKGRGGFVGSAAQTYQVLRAFQITLTQRRCSQNRGMLIIFLQSSVMEGESKNIDFSVMYFVNEKW